MKNHALPVFLLLEVNPNAPKGVNAFDLRQEPSRCGGLWLAIGTEDPAESFAAPEAAAWARKFLGLFSPHVNLGLEGFLQSVRQKKKTASTTVRVIEPEGRDPFIVWKLQIHDPEGNIAARLGEGWEQHQIRHLWEGHLGKANLPFAPLSAGEAGELAGLFIPTASRALPAPVRALLDDPSRLDDAIATRIRRRFERTMTQAGLLPSTPGVRL